MTSFYDKPFLNLYLINHENSNNNEMNVNSCFSIKKVHGYSPHGLGESYGVNLNPDHQLPPPVTKVIYIYNFFIYIYISNVRERYKSGKIRKQK